MELNERSPKNAAVTIIGVALVALLGYAVLRYHIAGPVPWKDFPFYVLNKGVSLTALILLTLNFTLAQRPAGSWDDGFFVGIDPCPNELFVV